MPENLLFRNAILESSTIPVDIAIRAGTISAIGSGLPAGDFNVIDVNGMLASPPFIDPHHHLDCAFLSEPPNLSGTLEEAIQINARLKINRSARDVYEKASRALHMALRNGTGWIRSHTDIDSVSKIVLGTNCGGSDGNNWPQSALACAFAYRVTQNAQYLTSMLREIPGIGSLGPAEVKGAAGYPR